MEKRHTVVADIHKDQIKLFSYIDFETNSDCNRVCPTCIRNSHPNKKKIAPWFEHNLLPIRVIKMALDQCAEMGFAGGVCLSHYNEPLMDERIPEIARLAKSYNQFYPITLNTNGDFITKDLAEELDGVLDKMIVSLYMEEPIKSKRKVWIESLFNKTKPDVCTYTEHIATHFSPKFNVKALAEQNKNNPCGEAEIRVIINHRRQYLLCCDDVVGNFGLGYFPDIGIEDFWFGEPHRTIALNLRNVNGRLNHPYCSSCPRA